MHPAQKENSKSSDHCPNFIAGTHYDEPLQMMLWLECSEHSHQTSAQMMKQVKFKTSAPLPSLRHLNRWRRAWGLSCPRGRPPSLSSSQDQAQIRLMPSLANVGLILMSLWLDTQSIFQRIAEVLILARDDYVCHHPDEYFEMVYHRPSTFIKRFQALFFAPLLGIKTLAQFDRQDQSMSQLLGFDYKASTMRQFLTDLERIHAADALIPLLSEGITSTLGYIDGHLFALWTNTKMHKGKITMLGRIMAGSQLVATHDEHGQAIYLDYYPPDISLVTVIIDYCGSVVAQCGVRSFVIDREVNSRELAVAFEVRQWGLLSMLNTNQYRGLESFDYKPIGPMKSGSLLYLGTWKDASKRKADPRHFVLCVEDNRILVFWGTSHFKKSFEPQHWPHLYRERNDLQENAFKHMIAHGALNKNYGIKKIPAPDRHHDRAEKRLLDEKQRAQKRLEKQAQKIKDQKKKISKSEEKGHGKRLQNRKRRLESLEKGCQKNSLRVKEVQEKIKALGEPQKRSDRDFRKQKIMTFRTLLLENLLILFFQLFKPHLTTKNDLGLELWIDLFLQRSGGGFETSQAFVYWLNSTGLSLHNRKILDELINIFNKMKMQQEGKPVTLRLRDGPS